MFCSLSFSPFKPPPPLSTLPHVPSYLYVIGDAQDSALQNRANNSSLVVPSGRRQALGYLGWDTKYYKLRGQQRTLIISLQVCQTLILGLDCTNLIFQIPLLASFWLGSAHWGHFQEEKGRGAFVTFQYEFACPPAPVSSFFQDSQQ